jgi:hypothetical protein
MFGKWMSRRAAITAAAGVPLSAHLATRPAVAEDSVADLIRAAEMKNAAFMRGDMDHWTGLVRIASDFTLMQPFGGPASRGFDTSPERLGELSVSSATG